MRQSGGVSLAPILFDCTRLISRSWTRRASTGIDRVCYAYLHHFGSRARAVVQHRGVFRTLTRAHSDRLFEMLDGPDNAFRNRMMAFAPVALARGEASPAASGSFYINVGHTDFDLDSHARWARASQLRAIYLLHDLIPLTHSDYCEPHAVRRHRGRVIGALRSANGIIVNSRSTQAELRRFAADQGLPMPPVLAAQISGAALAAPRRTHGAQDNGKPYFVCVGTIEQRKNHLMLLEIWARMAARLGPDTPRLVVIGQWGKRSLAVRKMLLSNPALNAHVMVLDRCDDSELAGWMAGSRALLMPSVAEGFGLPVVEALRLGTPVIASDLDCFHEVGQGVPLLLDAHDKDAWEQAVGDFAGVSLERERQINRMSGYRPPLWTEHFATVEQWMEALPALDTLSQQRWARSDVNHAASTQRVFDLGDWNVPAPVERGGHPDTLRTVDASMTAVNITNQQQEKIIQRA